MGVNLSDRIRALAQARYVAPALQKGEEQFSIRVRDVLNDLQTEGLSGGHTPQVCSALKTAKFLRENGLEIENVEGPPSKMSPTVVVRYRVTKPKLHPGSAQTPAAAKEEVAEETPEARALRLTEKLRGLLKEELSEYGGGEAFLRWVRGYDEEDAA